MKQLRVWLRELIDEPQDITLASLQERQRKERQVTRFDVYRPPVSTSLDPRHLAGPVAQK